ncbi:MAG TPA: hypothetical protein VM941_03280 [Pyrinomonadaceae bacterium]|nr:hypothetical protein [Pyrinomonadaceae bacterium]
MAATQKAVFIWATILAASDRINNLFANEQVGPGIRISHRPNWSPEKNVPQNARAPSLLQSHDRAAARY